MDTEEIQSVELVHNFFRVSPHGSLVAHYPYLFPVLGLPFYALLGFRGLFLLNAICFCG